MKIRKYKKSFCFCFFLITIFTFVIQKPLRAEIQSYTDTTLEEELPFYKTPDNLGPPSIFASEEPDGVFLVHSSESWFGLSTPGGDISCSGGRELRIPASAPVGAVFTDLYIHSTSSHHLALGDGTMQLKLNGVPAHPTTVWHGLRVTVTGSAPRTYKVEHIWSYGFSDNFSDSWELISLEYEYIYGDRLRNRGEKTYGYWRWSSLETVYTEIYYYPLVDGMVPSPAHSSDPDVVGTITQVVPIIKPLGTSIWDYIDERDIYGGYLDGELTRKTDETPMVKGDYVAKVNTSGASHLFTGDTLTGIGEGTLVWTITDYDGDITIYTQSIRSTSTGRPDVFIYLSSSGDEYDGRWLSTDSSADASRQDVLDIQGSSTIGGNYYLSTFINTTKTQTDEVNKTNSTPVLNGMIEDWSMPNTPLAGIPATSQAFALSNQNISLSEMSAAKRMYFDSTKPTITTVNTTNNWATITTDAQDTLSGIGGSQPHHVGDVFYKWVKSTDPIPTTPTDGSDWTSISSYSLPTELGEYNLYVYAKDNATNRSDAIHANKDKPITVAADIASITIRKEVNGAGNANDIFLITLKEGGTELITVALKDDGECQALELGMDNVTSKIIDVSEIIPMDYATNFTVRVENQPGSSATLKDGTKVEVHPGDNVMIVVENTFAPTGYFKGKDFVMNLFQ